MSAIQIFATGCLTLVAVMLVPARAQQPPASTSWQQCARLDSDPQGRLACYDAWASRLASPLPATEGNAAATAVPAHPGRPAAPGALASQQAPEASPLLAATAPTVSEDCHSAPASALSRFWELEASTDCGRFNIRGYRPISLSLIASDSVNTAPSSPTSGHTATEQPYLRSENRLQLSVRTKIGQGFLTHDDGRERDSLWFGYSQQSYWQLFTGSLSRPFRSTDHEPELIYIVPTTVALPGDWRLRYSGLSLNHQSNGQTLPLSRSWNRLILMAGMEKDQRYTVSGRLWQRITDGDDVDDNPHISDFVGRAEVTGSWQADKVNTLALTLRHSLSSASFASYRLEWLRTLGSGKGGVESGLRLHTQLFSGYGDSLLDYNRQRTVLSVGLSLVDW